MIGSKWRRPGFISLLDEIERRGRERYGNEWPHPPTEEYVRAEGERWRERAHRDFRPSIGPALPGGGARESGSADDIIGKSIDDFIGPDPRTIDGDPITRLMACNFEQTLRRTSIITTLNDQYERERSRLRPEIIVDLRSDLYEGKVLAIYENRLVDVPIDRMWWRLPEAETALSSGKYEGFEILLKIGGSGKSTPSKNNVIVDCQKWLAELRHESPDGYPSHFRSKDDFQEEAMRRFNGLTENGFESAWTKAAREVPLPKTSGWGKAGRKRSATV